MDGIVSLRTSLMVNLGIAGWLVLPAAPAFGEGLPPFRSRPALSQAAADTGKIQGRVLSARNRSPLSGARVVLEGTTSEASTLPDGRFVLPAVPAGRYRIRVVAIGYDPLARAITVAGGTVTVLDILLAARPVELAEIVVVGQEGYRASEAVSALKLELPLINTPAAISVVPQEVLQDQSATRLGDALKNVSGITRAGQSFGVWERFFMRGFPVGEANNFLKDGRRYLHYDQPPLEIVERVEVLKGPASVLYGALEPGGVINMVTKQPGQPHRSVTFATNSYGSVHPSADVSGPIGSGLGYRVNAAYEDRESFRDLVSHRRVAGGGVLRWNFGPASFLSLRGDFSDQEGPQDYGLVAIGDRAASLPVGRYLGMPWSLIDVRIGNIGLEATHQLGPSWKVRAWFNFQTIDRFRNDALPSALDTVTGDLTLRTLLQDIDLDNSTFDVNLLGDGKALGLKHKFLFGIDYINRRTASLIARTENVGTNIFNPTYTAPSPAYPPIAPAFRSRETSTGLYVQDVVAVLGALDALLSVRYDETFSELQSAGVSDEDASRDVLRAATPRFGLVYRPAQALSLYGSFSESFETQGFAEQGTNAGARLPPREGVQYEVGAKSSLFSDRLSATLAFFRTTQRNVAKYDVTLDQTVLTGEQLHRGVELDVAGAITEAWSVIGSFSHLDAEFTDDPVLQGNVPRQAPAYTASLWNAYELLGGALSGLQFGAGLFHQARRFGDDGNTFSLDPYTRLDAMISHRLNLGFSAMRARLLLENLTNVRYAEGQSRLSLNPGAPRHLRITTTFDF